MGAINSPLSSFHFYIFQLPVLFLPIIFSSKFNILYDYMVITAQKNSKNIIEAILWRLCTGATWHDIPQELCPLQTAYNRFHHRQVKILF
ncbi:transposase [Acinetobacter sp. ANC 4216]|nr:transposase [Acinetobacter sp. ANC 4216]